MQTPKEIFLELLKPDGKPDRELKQYEALNVILFDPINGYLRKGMEYGKTDVNRWGVTISFPKGAPGPMPVTTDELKVIKDITHWRDYVKVPDLDANCQDGWELCLGAAANVDRDKYLVTGFMGTGIFEQCHFLMGFEDTLTNLYEHPQEMHELIECITDFRIKFVNMLIDRFHPDAILSHDDWGTKDALFMSADMWREFFKEPYRRFYGCMRDKGVIAIHHADSYLSPIVEDMAEIGIQAWQGVLPENNIPELQKRLKGRMILMGGIGAAIDRADAGEEEVTAYVEDVLRECCPGGHFIPCITYGLPGTVYKHVDPYIDAAIDRWNSGLHFPSRASAAPVRHRSRVEAAAVNTEAAAVEQVGGETLEKISEALRKGQRKKVLELSKQALAENIPASEILGNGLVRGMVQLGADFSANRVFVPEMLVAAKCMNAATELLKPYLVSSGTQSAGRVCIGTVRGDMHDIGKNLVKIMMEGSGLEVIDLGTDVSAETFVQTAKERECGLIACSALLTTTMDEMRRVVQMSVEEGIRERVKIMIGGAPISQEFCDEIGADAYTQDAAAAALKAVELLKAV